MTSGLLVLRRTGTLFEVLGRTDEGPRQPYVVVSAFATDGFIVYSDAHLSICFTAWPLVNLVDWSGDPEVDVRPPLGSGCRWCGYGRGEHYTWSTQPVGFHTWTEPSSAQVNRRMRLCHEMRPPGRRRPLPR